MKKCLGVSKNLFLASQYMFQLIKYKSNLLALNLRSSKYRLKRWVKHYSFTSCLTHTELYYFSKKAQKHVLRLEIDSLRPKDTFPYPGYISRTIRTTLKNHSKSSPWFLLYFTFRKASKEPKYGHFGTRFLRFSRFWVMISKIALRGETTSQSTTKNIISVRGLLP